MPSSLEIVDIHSSSARILPLSACFLFVSPNCLVSYRKYSFRARVQGSCIYWIM
jgi:hypothetical protein